MPGEFEPIEKDIKDALTKATEDVEKGYPEHLKEIRERAEKVVADGTKKVDEDNAASIKKILDDMDANKSRSDITADAKAAEEGKLIKAGAVHPQGPPRYHQVQPGRHAEAEGGGPQPRPRGVGELPSIRSPAPPRTR